MRKSPQYRHPDTCGCTTHELCTYDDAGNFVSVEHIKHGDVEAYATSLRGEPAQQRPERADALLQLEGALLAFPKLAESIGVTQTEAEWLHYRQRSRAKNVNSEPQPAPVLCPVHASLGDTPARYGAISRESKLKTAALAIIADIAPDIPVEQVQLAWDRNDQPAGRVIALTLPTVFKAQAARLQAALDMKLGPGNGRVS